MSDPLVTVVGGPITLAGAIALGNAATTPEVIAALKNRRGESSALVAEHVEWALAQHGYAD